jgi:peptidoglycan/xylan/chitin deacetylase (PgdA/CDA1 family)
MVSYLGIVTIIFSYFCSSQAYSDLPPAKILERFYAALKAKDCELAHRLRPGYSKSTCEQISEFSVLDEPHISVNNDGEFDAVATLRVKQRKSDKTETVIDSATISRVNGEWKIIDRGSSPKKTQRGAVIELTNQSRLPDSAKIRPETQTAPYRSEKPPPPPAELETKQAKAASSPAEPPNTPQPAIPPGASNIDPAKAASTPGAATISPSSTPAPSTEFFNNSTGSTILESCWTSDKLRGHPSEKQIKKLAQDDLVKPNLIPEDRFDTSLEARNLPRRCVRRANLDSSKPYIALTFDLCESSGERAGYDAAIVNYLRDHQIKATFFAGGKWMRSHPEKTMQLIADPLFEIGNHSWSHENLRVVNDPKEIDNQILWTQAQYKILRNELFDRACTQRFVMERSKISLQPEIFRFPFGACSTSSLNAVNDAGLVAVQWDIVSGDPDKNLTADGMAKRIIERTKPGSIIIAHANGRGWKTAEALPLFIPSLQKKGYQFVTINELFQKGEAYTVDTCYENTPGDNLRYDKYFVKKR